MTNIQISLFDYSSLSSAIASQTKKSAEKIKLRLKRTAQDIVEIGKELIEVKANLPHGQFLSWIDAEFKMNKQMANTFMNVAERFGEKSDYLTFAPTILYMLASPSTPDEVVQTAIEMAENGEKITVAEVKRLKAESLLQVGEELRHYVGVENSQTSMSESQAIAWKSKVGESIADLKDAVLTLTTDEQTKLETLEHGVKDGLQKLSDDYLAIALDIKAGHSEMTHPDWLEWCEVELGYSKEIAESLLNSSNPSNDDIWDFWLLQFEDRVGISNSAIANPDLKNSTIAVQRDLSKVYSK